jgi:hypothetical protein
MFERGESRMFERGESRMFGTMLSFIMAWVKE